MRRFNALCDAQPKLADLAAWAYDTGHKSSAEKTASELQAALGTTAKGVLRYRASFPACSPELDRCDS